MNPIERALTRQTAALAFAVLGVVVAVLGFVWASSIEKPPSSLENAPASAVGQAAQLRLVGLGLGALILAAAAAFWFAAADAVSDLDED